MKKITSLLLFVGILAFSIGSTFAQKVPTIELYHGATCPYCHKFKAFLADELEVKYPDLVVNEYEVWNHPENQLLAQKRLAELGHKFTSVPTSIIDGEVIVGNDQAKVLKLFAEKYGPPAEEGSDKLSDQEGSNVGNDTKPGFFRSLWNKFLNLFS